MEDKVINLEITFPGCTEESYHPKMSLSLLEDSKMVKMDPWMIQNPHKILLYLFSTGEFSNFQASLPSTLGRELIRHKVKSNC